jgi:Fe2+ or Zn2+ uptake regulation protein
MWCKKCSHDITSCTTFVLSRSQSRVGAVSGDLHATTAARLQRDDQRYTARRRALVEVLADAHQPLTILQLLQRRGDLAQSSAYRNLAVLERAGVVHRIASSDEFARYELAEDLTEHHHHLICSGCGDVADFTVPPDVELELDRALSTVASRTGFQVAQHRLDLVGTCARCG